MTATDLDRQTRLRFFRIDQDTRDLLRQFWPKVEPEIDGILRGFYQHLRDFPAVQAKIADAGRVDRLIQAQKRHWQALFAADFDDAFMERVRKIGDAHHRIGLEPRWYIGAYGLLLERLQDAADRAFKRSGDTRRRLSAALVKAVFLDLEVAISVYQAADAAARDARTTRIGSAVERVDGTVRSVLDSVSAGLAEVGEASRTVAGAALETCRRTDSVTASADRATRNVQTVAAASEQLSASIQEITQQIAQSSRLADESMRKANRANDSVGTLNEAAAKIGDVVALINDIASQTNLLALNATIEAARAGEAGRGFAVVANEVKTLAGQTAQATEEISGQVAAMQNATGRTVEDIGTIVQAVDEIQRVAAAISAAMEEQSAATGEIARNISEAVTGTSEVSDDIVVVGENARNASGASDRAHRAVEDLARNAKALHDQIEGFFAEIRAA